MLIFSAPGLIKLLPALPKKWSKGRITGLCGRGGLLVNLEWDMKKRCLRADLRSAVPQEITVKFPARVKALTGDVPRPRISPSSHGPAYRKIELPAGRPVSLKATF
jgi:alpha-L-fucosidase 2